MMKLFKSIFKLFKKAEAKSAAEIKTDEIFLATKAWINRPIYKKLTVDIIDQTPDDELLQILFDNMIEKFPDDYRKEHETVMSFSKPRQVIYSLWVLDAEVHNGGFNQYYYNSKGKYAILTEEALVSVGANKFAELMIKANNLFIAENKKITEHQDGTLEGFSKSYQDSPLDDIDDEFYVLEKIEDLRKLQIEYVRKNKNDFIDE